MQSRHGSGTGALAAALELFDLGVKLMRQNLRRQHPAASDQEIANHLGAWLEHRPGAESGDCPGKRIDAGRFG